jgi:hypothetical protein
VRGAIAQGRWASLPALPPARAPTQEKEEYYIAKWSLDEATGAPLLVAAGRNGVIRCWNIATAARHCVSSR